MARLDWAELVGSGFTPLASAVFAGIWVNNLTDAQRAESDSWAAIEEMGWANLWLASAVVTVVGSTALARRVSHSRQSETHAARARLASRDRQIALGLLHAFCDLIGSALRVPTNARYFRAESVNNRRSLLQDRNLFVETTPIPKEYGFTSIDVDDPAFVSARAFRSRTPVFERLPDDHHNLYSENVQSFVDERQRWVLACPVLHLDPDGRHTSEIEPFGVVVFYGITEVPVRRDTEKRINAALAHSRRFTEYLSQLLASEELAPHV